MKTTIRCPQAEDLYAAAEKILRALPNERIFALDGKMGAGKTTLVKAFCEVLRTMDTASSPSFSIVNEYLREDGDPVYHFDFYRIKKITEVYDIGYEDYFFGGSYCFLEWPERIAELLPARFVYVSIVEKDQGVRELVWWVQDS